jgi:hypothetical protein
MVSLLITDLKPAPSAPRVAATGLTSVMRRGTGIDAANVGSVRCLEKIERSNMDAGRTTLSIVWTYPGFVDR